jgi:hypothetical protein
MEKFSTFQISMVGSESQETLKGEFKVKTIITPRDILRADSTNRELLGMNPENASQAARATAFMLSQLSIRILESPSWWREAGNGVDLEDMNVINEVFSKTMDAESQRKEATNKAAEEVVQKIKDKRKS